MQWKITTRTHTHTQRMLQHTASQCNAFKVVVAVVELYISNVRCHMHICHFQIQMQLNRMHSFEMCISDCPNIGFCAEHI